MTFTLFSFFNLVFNGLSLSILSLNTNPKNIKSLITNLNNSKRNSATNGSTNEYYSLVKESHLETVSHIK